MNINLKQKDIIEMKSISEAIKKELDKSGNDMYRDLDIGVMKFCVDNNLSLNEFVENYYIVRTPLDTKKELDKIIFSYSFAIKKKSEFAGSCVSSFDDIIREIKFLCVCGTENTVPGNVIQCTCKRCGLLYGLKDGYFRRIE